MTARKLLIAVTFLAALVGGQIVAMMDRELWLTIIWSLLAVGVLAMAFCVLVLAPFALLRGGWWVSVMRALRALLTASGPLCVAALAPVLPILHAHTGQLDRVPRAPL